MNLNQSPVRLRRFPFLSLRGKGDDSLAAGRPLLAVSGGGRAVGKAECTASDY
jgi:hypothetical protein